MKGSMIAFESAALLLALVSACGKDLEAPFSTTTKGDAGKGGESSTGGAGGATTSSSGAGGSTTSSSGAGGATSSSSGAGGATSSSSSSSSTGGACVPSAEVCDGVDNDCNGVVDDIAPGNDPNNCGGCGKVCASVNGNGVCAQGECTLFCNPGFADCDGNKANGCEASLSSPTSCGSCGNTCGSGLCGTSLAASMAAQPVDWKLNGNAYWDSASMSAVLTPPTAKAAGTLIYKNPIMTDSFTVSFGFRATGGAAGGDGLVFMIETNGNGAVGTNGGGLGAATLSGYGFELDSYQNFANCGDAPANHAGIDVLNGCSDPNEGVILASLKTGSLAIMLRNTGWHTAVVQVTSGVASMAVDGVPAITNFAIPSWSAGVFYYGFGAGAGTLSDRHEVKDVLVTFPTPRCL